MARLNIKQIGQELRDAIQTCLREMDDSESYSIRFNNSGKIIKVIASRSDEVDEIVVRIKWR